MVKKEDTIRAKMLRYLERNGYYCPNAQAIDRVAQLSVESHNEGLAKDLLDGMCRDESEPVRFRVPNETVCLKVDSQRWTASRIQFWDPSQLTWDQRTRLK